MEILNIFYNNNFIAYYLIGAILVVILIFIVISSMTSTPTKKDNKDETILEDPIDKIIPEEKEETFLQVIESEKKEPSKIDEIVEELYQQKINEEPIIEETPNLNNFLEEIEVPNKKNEKIIEEQIESYKVDFKEEQAKSEDIENMLKRLYDLRQSENISRKTALLNEIYDLKKQVDETLKSDTYNYSLEYRNIDTKALADYYLFNEDIEFPKLK